MGKVLFLLLFPFTISDKTRAKLFIFVHLFHMIRLCIPTFCLSYNFSDEDQDNLPLLTWLEWLTVAALILTSVYI